MYCHVLSNRSGIEWSPDEFIVSIGDLHLYESQLEDIRSKVLIHKWDYFAPCDLHIQQRNQYTLHDFVLDDFSLEGYHPEGYKSIGKLHVAGGY